MEIQIAKAGWLHRKSSVLHRWKKNWFVLYTSGHLAFFESDSKSQPEKSLVVCAVCTGIKTSGDCNFEAPEHCSKFSLLHMQMRDGEDLKLCAESPDDMRAWQVALEEARVMNNAGVNVPMGQQVMYSQNVSHPCYGGQIITTSPGQYVVPNAAGGSSMVIGNQPGQVVCVRQPNYSYPGYRGLYAPVFWW